MKSFMQNILVAIESFIHIILTAMESFIQTFLTPLPAAFSSYPHGDGELTEL